MKPQNQSVSSAKTPQQTIELAVGSYVKMKGQSITGRILKLSGNEALVAFGSIQTNVKLNRLEPSQAPKATSREVTFVTSSTQDQIRETTLNFTGEIDVRGLRGDECMQTISLYIDDALVANASRIRILHGTGNGILRKLIRQYLDTIPEVISYHDEHPQFGGAGITVVDIGS
jgi:DNA mismatch repair protein MutS2